MSLWVRALLVLGAFGLATGIEQAATDVTVTGSKWDERSSGDVDDNKGCFTDGCKPDLVLDGLLNTVEQSRWSCSLSLEITTDACYIDFDLGASFPLTKIDLYFRSSNDTARDTNPFIIHTSDDGITFDISFDGVNVAGTPLGTAEVFDFPAGSVGQYVRLEAILDEGQWISVNEAVVYVDEDQTPAPSTLVAATVAPVLVPTGMPTPGPTPIGGPECANVTVSGTDEIDGMFSESLQTDGTTVYTSTGTTGATIANSVVPVECADSSNGSTCETSLWKITPVNATLSTFLSYDEALHPALITEVWFRVEDCTGSCESTPIAIDIVCGDGSGPVVPSPTPAPFTASDCDIVEVAGTLGASVDGYFYNDGSTLEDGVAQYIEYALVGDDLSSTGNKLGAKSIDGACSDGCAWRQWWIQPDAGDETSFDYFTFDEADHPADIQTGSVWYTSNATVVAYNGDINVTCAPATAPTLPPSTVMPSSSSDGTDEPASTDDTSGGSGTRGTGTDPTSGDDDDSDTGIIIGAAVGGGVLLALVAGTVVYKKTRVPTPPPPPTYDDLMGA